MGIENLIDLYLVKEDLTEFDLKKDVAFSGKFIVINVCKPKTIEVVKNIIYSDEISNHHFELFSRFKNKVCELISIPSLDYDFNTKGGGEIIVCSDLIILEGTSGKYNEYDKKITKQLVNSYCKRTGINKEHFFY